MKTILLVLISSLLLMSLPSPKSEALKSPLATCYGKNPCLACKNCKYCKLCNKGGKCGICSTSKDRTTVSTTPQKSNILAQCKAITKKGSRCKRTAGDTGYCWQHPAL